MVMSMNKIIKHKFKNGLNLSFIKKEGFSKIYCGIGVKFGGGNLEYEKDGKLINLKPGIAHFIEHKLFMMPDGTDAFDTFSKLNASANAYTAIDKTAYYFTTNDDFYSPLKLLLDMYFTPCFLHDDVENEKNIILSELYMNLDDISYKIRAKSLEEAYPDDYYSMPILGTTQSIKSIDENDLYDAYYDFYTPNNSELVIVGDLDENYLIEFIENSLSNIKYSNNEIIKHSTIKSKSIREKEYTFIDDKITQDELFLIIRLDNISNKDIISCERVLGVFEALLSLSCPFYKHLDKLNLIPNGIDFQVDTSANTTNCILEATSPNVKKLAKLLIDKIRNLKIEDLALKQLDYFVKHIKAKQISGEDSISNFGDKYLSLLLENIDYTVLNDRLISLNIDDINYYLSDIKSSQILSFYVRKK